jgi:hypothetical protein
VAGTIDLLSPLPDLNAGITLQGPGASSLTVERAAGASSAFAILGVEAGQSASLSGLTIANGNGGGISNDGGTLTVSGCTISGNSATGVTSLATTSGGGIFNAASGTLEVDHSTVAGNSADSGGGIENDGTATIGDIDQRMQPLQRPVLWPAAHMTGPDAATPR